LKYLAGFVWALAALIGLWSFWTLEAERAAIPRERIETPAGPVVLYGPQDGPLVVVAHGFAGSLQMMQVISHDLARAGFTVAAFDFAGHGRSRELMSRDVTRIEGTTEQLVRQTVGIVTALAPDGPIALLGHSMATDIVIRAAERRSDVAGIVAISMYSDAVTADSPKRLLILSGEWESRLRDVALEAVRLVEPEAGEGQTAASGDVIRRAAVAPMVEHVGVLYSRTTLDEARAWLSAALVHPLQGEARSNGVAILLLLVSLVVLSGLIARLTPARELHHERLPLRRFMWVLFLPVLPAMGASAWLGGALNGIVAFGHLLVFFGIWGSVALGLMWRFGRVPRRPDISGMLILWGMCLAFAFALDRYGAAFLPTGPRLPLMLLLSIGTIPFMLADRLLVVGAALWQRALARLIPVLALFGLMLMRPDPFGLLFTVLPVLVLFYLVFGTMGRLVARRAGPETAGMALGVVLAWSIAASQPLFAAAM
jgi:pimeloyl-ACP methyl ester carboxylesterase